MNSISIGRENLLARKLPNGGFLYLTDHIPEDTGITTTFDPAEDSLDPLFRIDERHATEIAVALYANAPGGSNTLTKRDGQWELAKALKASRHFDTIKTKSEEVVKMTDALLFDPLVRNALCGTQNLFRFKKETRIIAHLDRAKIGDDAARTIGIVLMTIYKWQIICDDLAFYGRNPHTRLLREDRLIAHVYSLDTLKDKAPDLYDAVLLTPQKYGSCAKYDDAVVLAREAGLRPDPMREDNPYNRFIDEAMGITR